MPPQTNQPPAQAPMPDPVMADLPKKPTGLIVTLVIVIVLAISAVAGTWYFMNKKLNDQKAQQQQQIDALNKQIEELKNQPQQSSAQAPDATANWQTFSNSQVSLKYPQGWTAKDSSPSPGVATITGPVDNSIKLSGQGGPTPQNPRLEIGVFFTENAKCRETCKVYSVENVTTPGAKNTKLVISDWGSQNYPEILEVTSDPAAALNATNYITGTTINGKAIRVSGNVMYGENSSFGAIANVEDFKKTESYKNLVLLLGTLQVK